jgi:dTMP kinase
MGLAVERLAAKGYPIVQTREPGGTRLGERIRSVLLSPEHGDMSPLAELFLYEACRAQVVGEVVRPALERGCLVFCDRYFDATTAYQGFGRGLDLDLIERLNRAAGQGLEPDLTVLLDCTVQTGLERIGNRYAGLSEEDGRRAPDRLEQEDRAFHERIRQGYLRLAGMHGQRIRVVDASGGVDQVHAQVMNCLLQALKERG